MGGEGGMGRGGGAVVCSLLGTVAVSQRGCGEEKRWWMGGGLGRQPLTMSGEWGKHRLNALLFPHFPPCQ